MAFDDVVMDLLKQGLVEEAESLIEAASGMSSEEQERQIRFFDRALSGKSVDNLRLDPKERIVSFRVGNLSLLQLPKLIEDVLARVNKLGNSTYSLARVRRGPHTVVEIKIGS